MHLIPQPLLLNTQTQTQTVLLWPFLRSIHLIPQPLLLNTQTQTQTVLLRPFLRSIHLIPQPLLLKEKGSRTVGKAEAPLSWQERGVGGVRSVRKKDEYI
jgi:hypothetical protein